MLYKHIVAARVGIGSINILYISATQCLFCVGLEVVYKTMSLVETDELSNSAPDNALKLRSVKYWRTGVGPLHGLVDNDLNVKRISIGIDNYQQRRLFRLLHKPRYVYAGYSDRAYAFYVSIAARIARIGRVYIFKDIRPENISIGRNSRNGDIVVIGNRNARIRLDLQLSTVWLKTPIVRIWLEIRAVADIGQLLAGYVGIYLKRRQCISEQLVPITSSYNVNIFVAAWYIEAREPGNTCLT